MVVLVFQERKAQQVHLARRLAQTAQRVEQARTEWLAVPAVTVAYCLATVVTAVLVAQAVLVVLAATAQVATTGVAAVQVATAGTAAMEETAATAALRLAWETTVMAATAATVE